MASGDTGDLEWLSDYVVQILKSPTWVSPIAQFVDERCIIFDDEEENKLEYTLCHNEFKMLIDDLLAAHLLELSITPEQFDSFCQRGLSHHKQLHRILVEQLLSVEDYLTFKAMMVKRNADLYREALEQLERAEREQNGLSPPISPTKEAAAGVTRNVMQDALDTSTVIEDDEDLDSSSKEAAQEWRIYEDQLFKTIAMSEEEVDAAEARRKCEEAELQQAIALSIQAEEERLRQQGCQEPVASEGAACSGAFVPEQASTLENSIAEAASPQRANMSKATALSSSGLSPSRSALPRVVRMQPLHAPSQLPPVQAGQPGAAELLAMERERCKAILQQERERAERAMAAPSSGKAADAAVMPVPASVPARAPVPQPTEEERRMRAEHLKRQREILLEKRKQDRERQLGNFQRSRGGAVATNSPRGAVDGAGVKAQNAAEMAAASRKLLAELNPAVEGAKTEQQKADDSVKAVAMRQALTLQLRQTLSREFTFNGLTEQLSQLEHMKSC
eukprot:gnl/TRDRNA2_/TRDRNA2_72198_c0_seq1.p1 gnl/TRDRNA2_/TRDRNA2_72198_c0~~gnl/TRDRNA2_/TRDRNA2_72198_c0_seq1.p1  ORF type:complete len:506 (+),score=141.79 gnl/TRDRNA2_/TRDRNA2_72198_c0_seq1:60-1577(+)